MQKSVNLNHPNASLKITSHVPTLSQPLPFEILLICLIRLSGFKTEDVDKNSPSS